MPQDFRRFEAQDPFGTTWRVQFLWLQTGISIRRSDTVDVKFRLETADGHTDKVVAMPHATLLELSKRTGRPMTDPWCMKLAARHLREVIETGEDMEKTLLPAKLEDLERHAAELHRTSVPA